MLMSLTVRNARLLLVEDHRALAETILDFLQTVGFETDYAADGLTGLHLACHHHYDLIVLDVMLPGLNGFELCARLRNEKAITTPVLMLTARDQLQDKLEGFQHGADDYLVKPFDLPELVARLVALLRRSRGEVAQDILQVADLTFHTGTLEVKRAGQ
ncbi:MAG: response regulator transcription factor, partial [Pseudomonadota bacterium]